MTARFFNAIQGGRCMIYTRHWLDREPCNETLATRLLAEGTGASLILIHDVSTGDSQFIQRADSNHRSDSRHCPSALFLRTHDYFVVLILRRSKRHTETNLSASSIETVLLGWQISANMNISTMRRTIFCLDQWKREKFMNKNICQLLEIEMASPIPMILKYVVTVDTLDNTFLYVIATAWL